ncbi:structural maintenance of chromosomes protein 4 isoform X2 [Eurytemora carolleeae]|uniref:structural maintenance of chromosomes protein 4 isoform X2 n=1 Tax=Eurytemora carolleeae TaxID=1294199 RepID=UPI000C75AECA|nr:structural maintenance of chromosomes protein 4 isoform X2 [Eurytemora carolleeae]|eukprot:XP_023342676.1 structural maintenance of chromosomes protein 4-like isoform X2 [Eurytemora affinis]
MTTDYKMAELDLLVQHGGDRLYITFKQIKLARDRTVFLKIHLFPGVHEDFRTRSINTSLQKTFDETFTFFLPKEKLMSKSLDVEVFGFNSIGEESLGGRRVRFAEMDLENGNILSWKLSPANQETTTGNFSEVCLIEDNIAAEDGKDALALGADQTINIDEEDGLELMKDSTSDSSDSDLDDTEAVGEKITSLPDLNRRLKTVIQENRRMEGDEEIAFNLNLEMQNMSKEFIELNNIVTKLEIQIQEETRGNTVLQEKIEMNKNKMMLRGNKEKELHQKILEKNQDYAGSVTKLEDIKLEVERKKKENVNLKEDLEKIQLELVERIALKNVEDKMGSWFENLENIKEGRDYNPNQFSDLLESELANIREMIDKLNSGVQEKHALLLKDLEMQKPTQPQPSNRTNEEDDLKKKLEELLAEKISLKMKIKELEFNKTEENQIFKSKIQALDQIQAYLSEEREEMRQKLNPSFSPSSPTHQEIQTSARILDREIKHLESGELGEKQRMASQLIADIHNSANPST